MSKEHRIVARRRRQALTVNCPVCPRLAGRPCYTIDGHGFHEERAEAAYQERQAAK